MRPSARVLYMKSTPLPQLLKNTQIKSGSVFREDATVTVNKSIDGVPYVTIAYRAFPNALFADLLERGRLPCREDPRPPLQPGDLAQAGSFAQESSSGENVRLESQLSKVDCRFYSIRKQR